MRELSKRFMDDLAFPDGSLSPVLTRVKRDHTLMLALRDNYINIYYRGGNILHLTERQPGSYQASFDPQYNTFRQDIPTSPAIITSRDDADKWIASFPHRKNMMDGYFSTHGKTEREFQQLVARENNNSPISNESEYFISDIEVTDPGHGARFDMMAIRWLSTQRKSGNRCTAALIEMKYGDGALEGVAGLRKHLKDMDTLISNGDRYARLLLTMESQFNQLDELGLLNFNKGKSKARVKLDPGDKPEVIFILANHNPRSSTLGTILSDPAIAAYAESSRFDLRFFVASFAGYGLHAKCMLSLDEFRNLLGSTNSSVLI